MKRKERINKILKNFLKDISFEINDLSYLHAGHNNFSGDNETHFQIILKLDMKKKYKRIDIHRKINDLLKNEFSSGLHSLEIKINQL